MAFNVLMGSSKATATDWQFDKPLEPKLFAMEVPEGYALQHQIDLSHAGIEDVAGMLRIWVEARGGVFPDSLAPTQFQSEYRGPATAPTPQEEQHLAQTLGSAFLFLSQQGQATYAGKGVRLGDAATPIYWYQPRDSATATVIYGDLSIHEVDPAMLPSTRPTTSAAD
jgi:hypothetical protein